MEPTERAVLKMQRKTRPPLGVEDVSARARVLSKSHSKPRAIVCLDNKKSKGFVSNFCRSMIQKDELSKLFCSLSAHTSSVRSRLRRIAEWACLYHMLVEIINQSKNVQVSCPLLELCGRHVVMFQVKVPQISLIC